MRKLYIAMSTVSIVAAAAIEHTMGRILYCACGYIKFWQGTTWSSENSQHITDWYTFTHILHGFIFYWILQKVLPQKSVGFRMMSAVLVESIWEVVENSDFIINRYRAATISLNYFGDSIINSVSDILACLLGFWLARKLPVWMTISLMILFEVGMGYSIRDNLSLNLIMLIHPFTAIKEWQLQ